MKFLIVTGMSGAGKSTALHTLEDHGYFCVDNIPIPLVEKFSELAFMPETEYTKVAICVDIRSGHEMNGMQAVLEQMDEKGYQYEILFLDAKTQTLVKRYKETRRCHPLARDGRVEEGIEKERRILEFLRIKADYIIDSSTMLTRELRAELEKIFLNRQEYSNLYVTILSFGFKYGIPVDSDLVFDVRFLPNPYYMDELKHKTGQHKEVRDFVMQSQASRDFVEKLEDLTAFLLPKYVLEGKNQLVISIGCTGGKHRSVTIANYLYEHLKQHSEYGIKIEHRDILK